VTPVFSSLPAKASERVVVDTNALISRLLLPRSIPGQAVRKAVADCQLLASDAGDAEFSPFIPIDILTPASYLVR